MNPPPLRWIIATSHSLFLATFSFSERPFAPPKPDERHLTDPLAKLSATERISLREAGVTGGRTHGDKIITWVFASCASSLLHIFFWGGGSKKTHSWRKWDVTTLHPPFLEIGGVWTKLLELQRGLEKSVTSHAAFHREMWLFWRVPKPVGGFFCVFLARNPRSRSRHSDLGGLDSNDDPERSPADREKSPRPSSGVICSKWIPKWPLYLNWKRTKGRDRGCSGLKSSCRFPLFFVDDASAFPISAYR